MSATTKLPTPAPAQRAYRVKFLRDDDARFEECNGEARPLTEAEYRENSYQACPDHPRAGTQVLDVGGDGRPQIQGCAICRRTDYIDIPYSEYRAYYGNPAQHRYIGCVVEQVCTCCGQVTDKHVSSVWGIDLLRDGIEWQAIRRQLGKAWTAEEAIALPGYLGEVAQEELQNAEVTP